MSDSAFSPTQEPSRLLGTVVAVQANFYQVQLDQGLENGDKKTFNLQPSTADPAGTRFQQECGSAFRTFNLLCTRRTRLKKIGQTVMVGDRVLIEEPDYVEGRGAINAVLPRKTVLKRPPIANATQILLVFALEEPILEAWQLSRFLVKAESTGLDLCLSLNKADLATEVQQQQWQKRLQEWGYEPIFISVAANRGLEQLVSHLKQKITLLAGPSGVGKSSLINQLIPTVRQRVAQVSGKLQKGRHTTRHVELFELPGSGLLADTPGFNQADLDCEPTNLALYFPEARKRLAQGQCQFNNCLHRNEPNCMVRGDWERYEHYLKFLEEAIARQEALQQRPNQEASVKLKIKSSGQRQYEPKLESKKYRRHSRRAKQQTLQEFYQEQTLEDIDEEELM